MEKNIFNALQQINRKPKPFEYYTTPELWCDSYISKKMLETHLNEDIDLASRKKEFIDRSVEWMADRFLIDNGCKICNFGCGPGLYTSRFAKIGADVTGIDFSGNSINYAKEEVQKNNLNIEYVLQNYLDYANLL